jgi:hypothetical protein
MCNAARFLVASIVETEEALTIEADGRPGPAAERAVHALGFAEGAARTLNEVEEAAQTKAVWQNLIRAHKHAAQAASSLLPDFPELRGTGGASLQAARSALDQARPDLSRACFAASRA